MFLDEYNNKPKNKYMILLHQCGNSNLQLPYYNGVINYAPAKDITCLTITVYNTNTDRVSDKSAYIDKKGRLYIKCKEHGYGKTERLYLDDFK